jgi:hypothetical protein
MSWRSLAAPIITRVLEETKGQPEPVIRKALTDAYPFHERRMYPYKVWLDEINRQRKPVRLSPVALGRQKAEKADESLTLPLEEP